MHKNENTVTRNGRAHPIVGVVPVLQGEQAAAPLNNGCTDSLFNTFLHASYSVGIAIFVFLIPCDFFCCAPSLLRCCQFGATALPAAFPRWSPSASKLRTAALQARKLKLDRLVRQCLFCRPESPRSNFICGNYLQHPGHAGFRRNALAIHVHKTKL